MSSELFHDQLKKKMDQFVHSIYALTKQYPKHELYGVVSQIRRSTLSIILNYIEGYARHHTKVLKNFLEISYGSLKETKYLLHFSFVENYITPDEYKKNIKTAEEIGAMLWGIIKKL